MFDLFERYKKAFEQYSGLSPDSFKNHQNGLLLNLTFLERLDKEFRTLIKQHTLNWPTTCTCELSILADQLSKTIQMREIDKAATIMNLQLQQLSHQVRPLYRSLRQGERGVCS